MIRPPCIETAATPPCTSTEATNNLEVIAAATCNATDMSCANTATVPLGAGNGGGPMAIDTATHTVYVGGTADIVVVDARHCNAQDLSGCATQTPTTVAVGASPNALGVAPDTLYDAQFNVSDPSVPSVVEVIDTQHCQAADTSGCATQPSSQVHVGISPADTAVDLAHHTLYVPNNANFDSPAPLSMIDITHCSGDDTSGCAGETPPTHPASARCRIRDSRSVHRHAVRRRVRRRKRSADRHHPLQRRHARRLLAHPKGGGGRHRTRLHRTGSRARHPLRAQLLRRHRIARWNRPVNAGDESAFDE
jgi:hypothetical protein